MMTEDEVIMIVKFTAGRTQGTLMRVAVMKQGSCRQ